MMRLRHAKPRTILAGTAAALVAVACSAPPRGLLGGVSATPPAEVKEACTLAETKCSHCHPIERVLVSRGMGVHRWEFYVEQMRLKPSSGISLTDADVIFKCLRFVEESCTDCQQGPS